jgi:acetyl-CoA carboxylase biotin carboxyl carrier protein
VINVEQLRELAELMSEHGLSEIRVREGETTVSIRKGPLGEPVVVSAPVMPTAAPAPAAAAPAAPVAAPAHDENLVPIKSPMVGTFYGSPDPESSSFVHVGSEVDANTTVCIIEAMKVFNEIKAEVSGTIERILVQDEQAVEFGQPLMLVRLRG